MEKKKINETPDQTKKKKKNWEYNLIEMNTLMSVFRRMFTSFSFIVLYNI